MTWEEIPPRVKEIMVAERKLQASINSNCEPSAFKSQGSGKYTAGFRWTECKLGKENVGEIDYRIAWENVLQIDSPDYKKWETIYGPVNSVIIEQDGQKFMI